MSQSTIYVVGSTRIPVGLSQIIKISPGAYQYAEGIKIIAGSGTLEIIPPNFSGTSTSASASFAWGKGYPLGSNEVFNVGGPATFYLCASGATMTVGMLIGYTSGATII